MKTKRLLCALLVFLLQAALLACSNGSTTAVTTAGTTKMPASTTASNDNITYAPQATVVPGETSGIPDYLNMDTDIPIVKKDANITMKFNWLSQASGTGNPDDLWFFNYIEEYLGVHYDAFARPTDASYTQLQFASGDLPDIWIGGVDADFVSTYGVIEGQLLPYNQYTDTYMPNLTAMFENYPDRAGECVTCDGNMYSFGVINDALKTTTLTGGIPKMEINLTWLDQLGLEKPATLQEYLDVLRAFKTLGDDILPDSTCYTVGWQPSFIMEPFGFHWSISGNALLSVGMYDGQPSFIYATEEIFKPFLETYHTMYSEGLVSADFFTMDSNTWRSLGKTDKFGVVTGFSSNTVGLELCFEFEALSPLTSEYNSTPYWSYPGNLCTQGGVIIGDTEYPELCCRLVDHLYKPENYIIAIYSYPDTQLDSNLGYEGWTIVQGESFLTYNGVANHPDKYSGNLEYELKQLRPLNDMWGLKGNLTKTLYAVYGLEYSEPEFNLSNGDEHSRAGIYENVCPYITYDGWYPKVVYFNQEQQDTVSSYKTVINEYVEMEFAKFVTGARPITDAELESFYKDLDSMGYQDYLQVYVDYYNSVMG